MKKFYVKHDELGNITEVATDAREGWLEVPEGVVPHPNVSYAYDGVVLSFSSEQTTHRQTRPSLHHEWDCATMGWLDTRSLEQHKTTKWAEIKATREATEFSGFTWDSSEFDSDAISQARIQGAVILAMQALAAEVPFAIDWTLKDNSVRSLTGMQVVAVGQALATHVGTQHEIARALRTAIESAVTQAEVETITWPGL